MKSSFTEKVNKTFSSKIWYYIENILVVGLLFYCIKSLTDYDNVFYQTWKNEAAARAILAFTAIIFIIRKVRLLNWQSLVATLLFGAVVFERMHYWADSEDILAVIKPQMAAEWLTLMIIIDMILYKNVNHLFKGVNYLLILYVLMTIGMIWRRHDRMDPIVLVFPMFLFALVKMDEEKTEWFMRRFIDSWFISFVYVVTNSFMKYPYEGTQYYGYFLNIGQFGIFMVCSFTVAIISLYYSIEKYRHNKLLISIGILWLILASFMLYIINTRTCMIGVFSCLACLFLYARKNTSPKTITIRWILLGVAILAIVGSFIIVIKLCVNISDEWLELHSDGTLAPIITNINKLRWIINTDNVPETTNTVYLFFDRLTSYRLSIWRTYSNFFNFDGNSAIGFEMNERKQHYWVFGAHNTYIQFLVEYGYISLLELLLNIILMLKINIKYYLNYGKKTFALLPILWVAMSLGVWIGEANTFFYPVTFFCFMFIAKSINQDLMFENK